MDYIALLSVNCFLRRQKSNIRLLLTSFLSSIGSLMLMLFIPDTWIRRILIHFVLNMLMVLAGFGYSGKRELLENWGIIYLTVIFSGGVMEWLAEGGETVSLFVLYAFVTAVILTIVSHYLNRRNSFGSHLFPVKLQHKGVEQKLMSYWDSGNQLQDPYTGKPVCIVDKEIGEILLGTQIKEFDYVMGVRYIPFRSLGETEGLLAVYDVDRMQIFSGEKKQEITKAVIGLADKALFENKEYKMILHASMRLQKERGKVVL